MRCQLCPPSVVDHTRFPTAPDCGTSSHAACALKGTIVGSCDESSAGAPARCQCRARFVVRYTFSPLPTRAAHQPDIGVVNAVETGCCPPTSRLDACDQCLPLSVLT